MKRVRWLVQVWDSKRWIRLSSWKTRRLARYVLKNTDTDGSPKRIRRSPKLK